MRALPRRLWAVPTQGTRPASRCRGLPRVWTRGSAATRVAVRKEDGQGCPQPSHRDHRGVSISGRAPGADGGGRGEEAEMSGMTRASAGAALAVALALVSTLPGTSSAASAAVPLSPCVSADHGNPVVDALTVSRTRVDVTKGAQDVLVTVRAHDTGGPGAAVGLAHVDGSLLASAGRADVEVAPVRLRHVRGDVWQGTLHLVRGFAPDSYTVGAAATDAVGQTGSWFFGPAGHRDNVPLQVTAPSDRHHPVVTSLSVVPRRVDTRARAQRVKVSAHARDVGTGVQSVLVGAYNPPGGGAFVPEVALRKVRGTRDRWVGELAFPRWTRPGLWRTVVSVTDRAGGQQRYSPAFPRGTTPERAPLRRPLLHLRGTVDPSPPEAVTVAPSGATVDVRAGARVVVWRAHLRDPQSGVGKVVASVQTAFGSRVPLRMTLVRGTRRDGVWSASWTASSCTVAGPASIFLDVQNRAGGSALHGLEARASITVLNTDRRPPLASEAAGGTSTSRPISFDEDVSGLTASSARVQRRAGLFDPTVSVLPGHWVCKDTLGTEVDCVAGPVRVATFVADQPMTAPGIYSVELNPEHVLELVDSAGNPAVGSVFLSNVV